MLACWIFRLAFTFNRWTLFLVYMLCPAFVSGTYEVARPLWNFSRTFSQGEIQKEQPRPAKEKERDFLVWMNSKNSQCHVRSLSPYSCWGLSERVGHSWGLQKEGPMGAAESPKSPQILQNKPKPVFSKTTPKLGDGFTWLTSSSIMADQSRTYYKLLVVVIYFNTYKVFKTLHIKT